MSTPVLSVDAAKRLDIVARKSATFSKTITVNDSAGDPFDFTGYSARLVVQRTAGTSETTLVFNSTDGLTLSSGQILFEKTPTQMNVAGRKYFYFLEVTDGDGNIYVWLTGQFSVNDSIADNNPEDVSIVISPGGDLIELTVNVGGSGGGTEPTVFSTTVTLTDSQVKALDSTPIVLIAAQGANQLTVPTHVTLVNKGAASSASTLYVGYAGFGEGSGMEVLAGIGAGAITSQAFPDPNQGIVAGNYTSLVNKAIQVSSVDPISSGSTFDVRISITYHIIDLT